MNFGKWIVVSFVLFALFIATLVTVCMRQDISLVSKNYYEEELQFQHQIERVRNTRDLTDKPSVDLDGRVLTLALNQSMPITNATLNLFCPANDRMDRTFGIAPGELTQTFDLHDLNPGMYRVRIRWTMANKQFYQEEIINL